MKDLERFFDNKIRKESARKLDNWKQIKAQRKRIRKAKKNLWFLKG